MLPILVVRKSSDQFDTYTPAESWATFSLTVHPYHILPDPDPSHDFEPPMLLDASPGVNIPLTPTLYL
jgi:hypothetical protein